MAKRPAVAAPAEATVAAFAVTVNGEPRTVNAGTALPALLAELGLRPGSVVVELNGVALVPSELSDTVVADGDTLELVRAVAGG